MAKKVGTPVRQKHKKVTSVGSGPRARLWKSKKNWKRTKRKYRGQGR